MTINVLISILRLQTSNKTKQRETLRSQHQPHDKHNICSLLCGSPETFTLQTPQEIVLGPCRISFDIFKWVAFTHSAAPESGG